MDDMNHDNGESLLRYKSLRLREVFDIGPSGEAVRGAFDRRPFAPDEFVDGRYMVALWDHKTGVSQSMRAQPDSFITPKRSNPSQTLGARLWGMAGRLMLPARLRFNTARALCVHLPYKTLGSAWNVVKPNVWVANDLGVTHEAMEKALCVYLNSSVGALRLYGVQTPLSPPYARFSIDALRQLKVPDFAAHGQYATLALAVAFDKLSDRELLPLPALRIDPVRSQIDEAVAEYLGASPDRIARIRANLAAEPFITGKRHEGWE